MREPAADERRGEVAFLALAGTTNPAALAWFFLAGTAGAKTGWDER